jgi:hypothetical protein
MERSHMQMKYLPNKHPNMTTMQGTHSAEEHEIEIVTHLPRNWIIQKVGCGGTPEFQL